MDKPSFKDYRIDGSKKIKLSDLPTNAKVSKTDREKIEELTAKNVQRMADLQDRFYADGKEGLVILFQAMDAAGKDGTIKHVMSGVNPQGVKVTSFKTPSKEELAHDYLWRVNHALPERGHIGIFNRSYYEDVLVVRVHEMQRGYNMAPRTTDMDTDEFFDKRYRQIRNYEQYLSENSYRVVKVFLNVSKEEQKERFLARIDEPSRNWKFSSGDIAERALWDDYMKAYELMINGTASKDAPWYAVPADQKWVMRYLVSEIIVDVLEQIDPQYPALAEAEVAKLQECREALMAE